MSVLSKRMRQSDQWQRLFRTRAEDVLPHDVMHQRIYIMPSRRGITFVFTVLLMLIASINYALSLGYALSFMLSGLFAASLLHTYKNLAGLRVLAIDVQDVFANDVGEINVTLENVSTHIRHGISVSIDGFKAPLVHALPESTVLATIYTGNLSRGTYKPGRITLNSDWPLGLWTCWSYLHVSKQGFVYPAPEANPPPLPSSLGDADSNQCTNTTAGDVSGLREYRPGDSIGSIAWKSAARGTGLRVRTFEAPEDNFKTTLSIDHAGNQALEQQLSRLSAWVLVAESQHTEYAVELKSQVFPTGLGKQHSVNALQALSVFGHPLKDNQARAQ